MRLSRFSDLSLRALMYMGAHPKRPVPTREIARAFEVSEHHLSKGLQALRAAGVVRSTPGRNGGFRIRHPLEEIRIGTVVRAVEPSMAMAECFEPLTNRCPLATTCTLADALTRAQNRFIETLDEYTVADLLPAAEPVLVELSPWRPSSTP